MLSLLYGCGLRRSEAVALQLADYKDGEVKVRTGKGRKERIVYSANGGRAAHRRLDRGTRHLGRRVARPGGQGRQDPAAGHLRPGGHAAPAVPR